MSPLPVRDEIQACHVNGASLYHADVERVFATLGDDSVDLAIADPPYGASTKRPTNLIADHGLAGFGGAWKAAAHDWDYIGPGEQLELTLSWLSELKRVVKPEGSIWIHGSYHNIGFVNVACQILGLEIINEVVWFKRNAMPNLRGRRLTASHETLLWVHTGGKKRRYRFNYEVAKDRGYEGDNIKAAGKQMRTVWDIPNNKTKPELNLGGHPTQKPERLIQRLIDISAPDDGLLLSPFAGSGTDMVIAMRNGLRSVGAETEIEYFEMASKRLAAEAESSQGQLFRHQR
jgi:site-specific DNA-methyltransferase (adenine-specific)